MNPPHPPSDPTWLTTAAFKLRSELSCSCQGFMSDPVLIRCWQTPEDEKWLHVTSATCVAILRSPPLRLQIFTKFANSLPYRCNSVAGALAFRKGGILCGHGEFWTSCFVTCIVVAGHHAEGYGLLLGSCETMLVFVCSHFTSSPRLRFVLCRDFFMPLVLQC